MPAITQGRTKTTSTVPLRFIDAASVVTKRSDNTEGEDRLPSVLNREPQKTSAVTSRAFSNSKLEDRTENQIDSSFEVSPLIRLEAKVPDRVFEMHQHYEGLVVENHDGGIFTAELSDLTNQSFAKEVAEISLQEISDDDHHLIRPGAIFYWSIGIERSKGGQVRRVSEIRVRRLPVRTRSAFERAIQEGRKMFEQVRNAT